ncbi:MAG: ribosome-associated translation inhibitor RaiA [Bdellovibrionaceae bacterium]|nr:ribosome-associated translation inhibitor RaiA [Pseudobdellovibrionaceae bacterium]
MKSNYSFKHLDYSESLVKYSDQKIDEVGKFLLKEGQCHVFFWKENHEFFAEVTVNTRQKFFKATAHAADIYAATDLVCDKLEKQFIKVKEVYTSHKKTA